jgi:hypothetical protein
MVEISLTVVLLMMIVNLWFTVMHGKGIAKNILDDIKMQLENLSAAVERNECSMKNEFFLNRNEANENARAARTELSESFKLLLE